MADFAKTLLFPHKEILQCGFYTRISSFSSVPYYKDNTAIATIDSCNQNLNNQEEQTFSSSLIIYNITTLQDLLSTFLIITTTYKFWGAEKKRTVWKPTFLLFYENEEITSLFELRQQLENSGQFLGLDTDFFIAFKFRAKQQWIFYEVYEIGSKKVQSSSSFSLILNQIKEPTRTCPFLGKVGRRRNFKGIQIRAASARDPTNLLQPPNYSTANSDNSLEILEDGTSSLIFSELKYALNFTVPPLIKTDWLSRHSSNDSVKVGVTVSLFRNRSIDIFIGLVSLLPYRAKELAFLQPTYSEGVSGFFIQPPPSSLRDLFQSTFPPAVLGALIGVYGLVLLAFIPISRIRQTFLNLDDVSIILEKGIWAVGTLCQQGWYLRPTLTPLRILFLVGYVTGLVVYVAFSAAIVSELSVVSLPIGSRSALLSSLLPIYADSKSSTMAYIVEGLKSSPAAKKAKFGPPVTIPEGIEKLRTFKPATYLAFPHYFYLIGKNASLSDGWVCKYLSSYPVSLTPTPHAMLLHKNSQYLESFNYVLIKRFERGLHHRFVTAYTDLTTTRCLTKAMDSTPAIGVGDVFTGYVILFVGGFLGSSIFFVIERFCMVKIHTKSEDQEQIQLPRQIQPFFKHSYPNKGNKDKSSLGWIR